MPHRDGSFPTASLRPRALRGRRGSAALAALAMLPMTGFAALVFDVGMAVTAQAELQNAVDAATLAGAAYLDGTPAAIEQARAAAKAFAVQNRVLGVPVELADDEIHFGRNDKGELGAANEPKDVDGVAVETGVQGGIGTLFAGVAFGKTRMWPTARAMARGPKEEGAGQVDCFLPLAVPDCYLGTAGIEDIALRMASSNADNAGWARINASPNADQVKGQILGQCGGGPASIEDEVGLNNGQITSALDAFGDMIDSSDKTWDSSKWGSMPPQMSGSSVHDYGKVVEGPIILFRPAGGTCGASTQFNGFAQITGFAWAVVYDVKKNGGDKNIRVKLDLSYEYHFGTAGGGLDSSVIYTDPISLVY